MTEPAASHGKYEFATTRRFALRVLPLFCLFNLITWFDRADVSFAKLQMRDGLGMTEGAFGFAASLFFVSYVLVQLPVSSLFTRIRPARLLAAMFITWGTVEVLTAFISSPTELYVLRMLLGLCEGGVGPLILCLIALWVPYGDRAEMSGIFMGAGMLANVISGPICGALLQLGGFAGLEGWQSLFLLTGLTALAVGACVLVRLPDGPGSASFYSAEERAELARILAAEHPTTARSDEITLTALAGNVRVLVIAGILFTMGAATFGLSYWLPTLIQQFGVSSAMNGILTSIPWLFAVLGMLWLPARAERSGKRNQYLILCLLLGAIAFAAAWLVSEPILQLALICIGAMGIIGVQPLVAVMPTKFLTGASVAAALAMCAMGANLGAFAGQNAMAQVGGAYGPEASLLVVAVMSVLSGLLSWWAVRLIDRPAAQPLRAEVVKT
jgi:sugar phosphate permease